MKLENACTTSEDGLEISAVRPRAAEQRASERSVERARPDPAAVGQDSQPARRVDSRRSANCARFAAGDAIFVESRNPWSVARDPRGAPADEERRGCEDPSPRKRAWDTTCRR